MVEAMDVDGGDGGSAEAEGAAAEAGRKGQGQGGDAGGAEGVVPGLLELLPAERPANVFDGLLSWRQVQAFAEGQEQGDGQQGHGHRECHRRHGQGNQGVQTGDNHQHQQGAGHDRGQGAAGAVAGAAGDTIGRQGADGQGAGQQDGGQQGGEAGGSGQGLAAAAAAAAIAGAHAAGPVGPEVQAAVAQCSVPSGHLCMSLRQRWAGNVALVKLISNEDRRNAFGDEEEVQPNCDVQFVAFRGRVVRLGQQLQLL